MAPALPGQEYGMPDESNDPDSGNAANPYQEPANSTVDDWLGQRVERDAELADKLVEQEHGDEKKAEQRFNEAKSDEETAQ